MDQEQQEHDDQRQPSFADAGEAQGSLTISNKAAKVIITNRAVEESQD